MQAGLGRHRPATPHGAGGLSWESTPLSNPKRPLQDVEPVEPIAPWTGGKRRLWRRIAERIEAVPHDCYAEPFCGMAAELLISNGS